MFANITEILISGAGAESGCLFVHIETSATTMCPRPAHLKLRLPLSFLFALPCSLSELQIHKFHTRYASRDQASVDEHYVVCPKRLPRTSHVTTPLRRWEQSSLHPLSPPFLSIRSFSFAAMEGDLVLIWREEALSQRRVQPRTCRVAGRKDRND
jgi:hypothetical protein